MTTTNPIDTPTVYLPPTPPPRIEVRSFRQEAGAVYLGTVPAEVTVPADSMLVLLQVVLTAIRVQDKPDEMALAATIVRAHLGRYRP